MTGEKWKERDIQVQINPHRDKLISWVHFLRIGHLEGHALKGWVDFLFLFLKPN